MLPSGETFSRAMQELGIRRDDTVVVYDSPHLGIFSGPRVAWIFRVFGHPKVHLLNNFKLWVERGLPTETGPVRDAAWEKSDYPVVKPDESIVVSFEEMVKHARDGTREGVEIIDARPNGRFLGIDPEPRPGLWLLPSYQCYQCLANQIHRALFRTCSRFDLAPVQTRTNAQLTIDRCDLASLQRACGSHYKDSQVRFGSAQDLPG